MEQKDGDNEDFTFNMLIKNDTFLLPELSQMSQ